jgi:hypothetical protein
MSRLSQPDEADVVDDVGPVELLVDDGRLDGNLGSISRNSILAKKFSDKYSSSKYGFTQK